MNPNVHIMIKNEYDRRRKRAYDLLEERKAGLYKSIPRLEEIEDEIHLAGIKYNKLQLEGVISSDSAVNELSALIDRLKSEKAGLLASHGYPADYLEPVFTCKKCSDTGTIKSGDGGPDILCICYRQQLINIIYKQSNITIAGADGFGSFMTDFYEDAANEKKYGIKKSPRQQILGIKENCVNFVGNFNDPEVKSMLFCGPTGVGKTFMAGCIASELMNRGFSVLYQTAPALFNMIYEYRYKSSGDEAYDNSTYQNILEAELLIIDDLGTESPSAMRYTELLGILDARFANDRKKPCKTIIATNIDLKKLFDYYDERIVSRITGRFDLFRFAGDDIRIVKSFRQR